MNLNQYQHYGLDLRSRETGVGVDPGTAGGTFPRGQVAQFCNLQLRKLRPQKFVEASRDVIGSSSS